MVLVKEFLQPKFIKFLNCSQKSDCLSSLIETISESDNIIDKEAFSRAVFDRENIMSTGLGLGIAIPHVKIPEVSDLTIAIGIHSEGVEWEALDGEPVQLIFLIAGSADQHQTYLQTVAKLMLVLKNAKRREQLKSAQKAEEVMALFSTV